MKLMQTDASALAGLKICSLNFKILEVLDLPARLYLSKQATIVSIYQIFKDQSETFFNMFGEIDIHLPPLTENKLLDSHIPEIGAYFGREVIDELYKRFGERATISVPAAETVREILTDLILYLNVKSLKESKRKVLSKKLSEQYGVPYSKVHLAYRKVMEGM